MFRLSDTLLRPTTDKWTQSLCQQQNGLSEEAQGLGFDAKFTVIGTEKQFKVKLLIDKQRRVSPVHLGGRGEMVKKHSPFFENGASIRDMCNYR